MPISPPHAYGGGVVGQKKGTDPEGQLPLSQLDPNT